MQRGDGDDMSRDDGDVMHRGDDDKEITNFSTGDSMPDGKQYLYSYEGSEITSLNWARFTAEQHERNILPVKKKKGSHFAFLKIVLLRKLLKLHSQTFLVLRYSMDWPKKHKIAYLLYAYHYTTLE